MNWRKFSSELERLTNWLEEQGCQNSKQMVLKLLLLSMLKNTDNPAAMMDAARNINRLQELFSLQGGNWGQEMDLPEDIYALLDTWHKCLMPDPELLGKVYEKMASGARKKGVYYTPRHVVDFILKHTSMTYDIVQAPFVKILDPACGCGYFLLAAYDLLFAKFVNARKELQEKHPNGDWTDDGIHRHILTYNLWGADVDTMATEVTIAALQLKRGQKGPYIKTNILCCDSLKPDEVALERSFWQQPYDFVVGNPPYLSFGLRGTSRLQADYETYLRHTYHASAEYKLSYYVLFMQKGIDMLAPGGKLGFIVPDSFLLGRYYSKIRKYILEHAAIDLLAHVSSEVFKNASPGFSVICILSKEVDAAKRQNQQVLIYQLEDTEKFAQAVPSSHYQQEYFHQLPYQRFRLFFDDISRQIINKMDDLGQPLGNYLTGYSGIRSLSKQSDIIASQELGSTFHKGLISGRQVCRYALLDEGHWLNIDPALLYKGGWYPEQVNARKLLMRQTGDTLTSCIDNQGFYHLNNIHGFILKSDQLTLDYLLLILNSRLFAFYYHVISMEYGRSMAQTDIETIELLPLCIEEKINSQAPKLVEAMEICMARGLQKDADALAKANTLDAFIDQLVYHIYQLTDDEISYVEQYEASLTAKRKKRFFHSK